MPYSENSDLPLSVRKSLPPEAQTIWRKAFNAALEQYGDEEVAARVAWAAVKKAGFRKSNGRWVRSQEDNDMEQNEAVWTRQYINDLPDSAFLYVEPGGKKDAEGKTVPRSKRHLPYKDKNGKVDLPHLRNAIARLEQGKTGKGWLTPELRKKLLAKARRILKQHGGNPSEESASAEELVETIEDVTLSLKEADDGYHYVTFLVSRGNYVNRNGRVYPTAIWQREAARLRSGEVTGQAGHPWTQTNPLDQFLLFTDGYVEGDDLYATAKVIPTSKGKDFIELAKAGVKLSVSTRGKGSTVEGEWTDESGKVHKNVHIVQDDYTLRGIDVLLMGDQSVEGANLIRFEAMEETSEVDELTERLGAAEELVQSLEEKLESANEKIEELTQALKAKEAAISEKEEQLDKLTEQLSSLSIECEAFKSLAEARSHLLERVSGDPFALPLIKKLWDEPSPEAVDERFERAREEIEEELSRQVPDAEPKGIISPKEGDDLQEEAKEPPPWKHPNNIPHLRLVGLA